MKKTIHAATVLMTLILISGIVLSIQPLNDGRPPEVPPDADVQIGEHIEEVEDIVTKETHITIERIHQENAGVGEEVEITLRVSNLDGEDIDVIVDEFHIVGVDYLGPIETQVIYYQALEVHYYSWTLSLPAYGSEEIRYHIKSDFPRLITFPPAHVADQYGNHFDSMPTLIEVRCIIDDICAEGESFLNCPGDCGSGSQDDVCDAVADGINDPDCSYGTDPDYDPDADTDGDGVADKDDICPGYPDIDSDSDGKPDGCDRCPNDAENDVDNDGVCGDVDNCPTTPNSGQEDCNNNGVGDACDAVNPNATEVCDNLDNNCDGQIDETICGEPTDADCDGVNDCTTDKCLSTVPGGNEWYTQQELKPNHYDSSNWPASDVNYGCSCAQVLYCKPGGNGGEFKFGCSEGTKKIWEAQSNESWALECQVDDKVTSDGVSKPFFENTDSTGLLDIFDGDNDGDGIPDSQDDMIEDQDLPGDPDYGIPDWHPKSKHNK